MPTKSSSRARKRFFRGQAESSAVGVEYEQKQSKRPNDGRQYAIVTVGKNPKIKNIVPVGSLGLEPVYVTE